MPSLGTERNGTERKFRFKTHLVIPRDSRHLPAVGRNLERLPVGPEDLLLVRRRRGALDAVRRRAQVRDHVPGAHVEEVAPPVRLHGDDIRGRGLRVLVLLIILVLEVRFIN